MGKNLNNGVENAKNIASVINTILMKSDLIVDSINLYKTYYSYA